MEQQIILYAKEHFYFVIITIGVIVVVGCIFDWKWITRIDSPWKMPFIRAFIEVHYGVEARYKFERIFTFIAGVLITIIGLVYWYFCG